ncbi:EH signature domain-containing protein [Cystobacter ferrugineus]|uniref:Zorya protein ZorC EH domain-containing protein n=1 Tax=Cystobacter ferrugineus TaxID=83449 RepID=A0A1L9ATS7_9BACT|nr:EH signature domain-containing protein [Cystobacter ferrugineus]OJH33409.1 hypothetical protein BON30_48850 [Cystobacter ferrugineus]
MSETSFRKVLARGAFSFSGLADRPQEWVPKRMERALQSVQIQLQGLEGRPPATLPLDDILAAMRGHWERHGDLDGLPLRLLRRVPWVLFYPAEGDPQEWLGADRGLSAAYLRWAEATERRSILAALVRVFLIAYPTQVGTFSLWREGLEVLARSSSLRLSGTWVERCEQEGLLRADAPTNLREGFSRASPMTVSSYLESRALGAELDRAGLVLDASREMVEEVRELLEQGGGAEQVQRRLSFFLDGEGDLRFDELRTNLAVALLTPHLSRAPIMPALKETLQRFLLRYLGDPRLGDGRWVGVDLRLREVLVRWLVQESFDVFFEVLSQTAMESHWAYRRPFWEPYLTSERVTGAWAVLGPDARQLVLKTSAARSDSFGVLPRTGGKDAAAQSVLLMQMRGPRGSVTVAEFSHNGSCRIWREGNSKAPRLYQRSYERTELTTAADFEQRHAGSERGTWQRNIRDWLRWKMGITPGHDGVVRGAV